MFSHGQIEGFTEKYGMEYYRPRYEESPDHWLVERHQREIAPLLKRRHLFAESNDFLLYDFFQGSGSVDENVFAYSNRVGGERALVVFNNRYGSAHGTIDTSAAYADKAGSGLRRRRLAEGLGLVGDTSIILAWRDSLTGLEYLRRANDLANQGLTLDLHAYQCHVFLDWRELRSTAQQPWDRLCDQLNGSGVPNLDDALVNLELRHIHDALRVQFEPALVRQLIELADARLTPERLKGKTPHPQASAVYQEAWFRCENFLRGSQSAYLGRSGGGSGLHPTLTNLLGPAFRDRLSAALSIPTAEALFPAPWTAAARRMLPSASPHLTSTALWGPILGWCALELLAESLDPERPESRALDIFDRLRLREPFAQSFAALGFEGEEAWRAAARIKVLLLATSGAGEIVFAAPLASVDEVVEPEPQLIQEEEDLAGEAPIADEEAVAALELVGTEVVEPPIGTLDEPSVYRVDEENPAVTPGLWQDPDLRWLVGVHEAKGHIYLVREKYEELLWWLQLPALLRLPVETAARRLAVAEMSEQVTAALDAADACDYRLDGLIEKTEAPKAGS